MKHIIKTIFLCILIIGINSGVSWGQSTSISLGAGSDSVELDIMTYHQVYDATMFLGGGVSHIEDDYTLYNLSAGLMDNILLPELTLGLGFKAIYGDAEIDDADLDVGAFGFTVLGEYDFREASIDLPVSIYANVTLAPDSLTFKDTEKYTEFNVGINAYIIRNGAVVAGYTKIDIDFDVDHGSADKSENKFFLGFRLTF